MTKQEKKIEPSATPRIANKRERVYAPHSDIVMTKQEFAAECDINNIINMYNKTGQVTHLNTGNPQYGYASSNDFRESLEIVKLAEEHFDSLPSKIRGKFNNSPEQFLEFAQNPENQSEMVAMGLIPKPDTKVSQSDSKPVTEPSEAPETKPPADTLANKEKST